METTMLVNTDLDFYILDHNIQHIGTSYTIRILFRF